MLSPVSLIAAQRQRRLLAVCQRVEAEDTRTQFYGVVAGYDGTIGQWLVRIRGGVALPARVLKPTNLEIGEVVSVSQDSSGDRWLDKL